MFPYFSTLILSLQNVFGADVVKHVIGIDLGTTFQP